MPTENKVFISPEGEHDYNKKYEQYSIVTHTQGDIVTAYLAIKPVPPFISITDKNFWKSLNSGTDTSVDISGKADKVNTPQIFNTTEINALTDAQCREIKTGDIVVISNNGVNYTCTVSTKTSNTLYMYYMYGDTKTLFRIKYQKTNGTWSFAKRDILNIEIPRETVMPQSGGMNSNTLYILGELNSDTTFVLSPVGDNTIANVWIWTFSTGSTAPTITWPAQITMWSNGDAPDIEANKYYEVSAMNGVGTVISADILQEEETEVEP